MPVLPYQKILYNTLQNHKHIWCLKSRGIGVTTFLLTIEEQSGSIDIHNQMEKEHRMRETRFAQIGAILLIAGFSVQIAANVTYE
jgi:hypothetical protein